LEVDLLTSDQHAVVPAPVSGDLRERRTVLVVASDGDVREHVVECLRPRTDLLVVDATPVAAAKRLADAPPPSVLVVDAADVGVLEGHLDTRAVLIVDELPRDAWPNANVVSLARPFSARQLESLVDLLLT
jgi:hypothetical protein